MGDEALSFNAGRAKWIPGGEYSSIPQKHDVSGDVLD